MQVDYLIIGLGISGTMLSYEFAKAGLSFIVIDDGDPSASSRVAAGMINPVTGRRIVKTWMIDELLPVAYNSYMEIGQRLSVEAIHETPVVDFFPNQQMNTSFYERVAEIPEYLEPGVVNDEFERLFTFHYGYGIIRPAYTVNSRTLLPAWRKELQAKGQLIETHFDVAAMQIESDGIRYESIRASKVIFCNGSATAKLSWFKNLPFAENKGQALILEIKDFPAGNIFAKGLKMLPLGNDQYWVGSSYEWDFTDPGPTAAFRERTMIQLSDWLKVSFKVVDHVAALRPATLERRPFVGFHPQFPSVGIFNGMGTKGYSLAPYFAKEFTRHLLNASPINPTADVQRFKKVLAR